MKLIRNFNGFALISILFASAGCGNSIVDIGYQMSPGGGTITTASGLTISYPSGAVDRPLTINIIDTGNKLPKAPAMSSDASRKDLFSASRFRSPFP